MYVYLCAYICTHTHAHIHIHIHTYMQKETGRLNLRGMQQALGLRGIGLSQEDAQVLYSILDPVGREGINYNEFTAVSQYACVHVCNFSLCVYTYTFVHVCMYVRAYECMHLHPFEKRQSMIYKQFSAVSQNIFVCACK
jgi:hypothetical protein